MLKIMRCDFPTQHDGAHQPCRVQPCEICNRDVCIEIDVDHNNDLKGAERASAKFTVKSWICRKNDPSHQTHISLG